MVDQFRLVIPVFHTEFDALQLSFRNFPEIPPYGGFGDFLWLLWLFSPKRVDQDFGAIPYHLAHMGG